MLLIGKDIGLDLLFVFQVWFTVVQWIYITVASQSHAKSIFHTQDHLYAQLGCIYALVKKPQKLQISLALNLNGRISNVRFSKNIITLCKSRSWRPDYRKSRSW